MMHTFYNLLNDKDKGMIEFLDLLEYMVETRKYIHLEKYDGMRNDFEHHFDQLPNYYRENLTRFRHEILSKSASVNMAMKRISDAIDEFTIN